MLINKRPIWDIGRSKRLKKALRKDTFKEIRKSYKRFISILLMAFMGVGFFAGVRATSPDMELTLDTYLDKRLVYDIRLISTLGLTDDDINEISELDNVEKAVGIYSEDVFVSFEDEEIVVKVYGVEDDINNIDVIEGKLPENADECVIEPGMQKAKKVNLGDYIEIKENLEEDEDSSFKNTKLKVVGIAKSPLYISSDRGTTTLGSGKVSYFMYVNKENIDSDIYTEININVAGAKELSTLSDEYKDKIGIVVDELEDIKEERQDARYIELITEANEKLDDAQKEFDEEKADAEKKIKDAENEIADGKKEIQKAEKDLENGAKELQEGRDKATNEFFNAEAKIAEGETELIKSQEKINESQELLDTKKKEAESGIAQLKYGIEEIDNQISNLTIRKSSVEEILNNLNTIDENLSLLSSALIQYEEQLKLGVGNIDEITQKIEELNIQINNLNERKSQLEATGITQETLNQINSGLEQCKSKKLELETTLNTINTELENAQNQINEGQIQINSGWDQINNSKSQLATEKAKVEKELADAEAEITDGRKEIEKAKKELEDGEKELEEKKEEFNTEIAKAESKLIDAREKVNDIEKAKWYIFDRDDNKGFGSFSQDVDNIKKLGDVFPIVFFIIATLISLTSMSRMVEEERVQIGTLKALGYNKGQIMYKYITYSFLASIIGGCLGAIFGMKFFPTVIISMYQMMYDITELIIEFNKYYGFLGIGIMSLCIVGATIYTASKELSSTPAEMMRPKAPKAGKRVLLERIPFIWNRFNFIQKVTLRNMFRYKKKFFMTVIGICGCTALVLVGFGLKDSISKIMDYQYVDIYNFDMLIGLKETLTQDEKNALISSLEGKEEISKCLDIYMTSESAKKGDLEEDAQIVITNKTEELDSFIKLKDLKTGEKLTLNNNEVIITDKLAQLIDANVGDEIILLDSDNNEYKVTVGAITEHYISHYVYMTEELYENVFGEEVSNNVIYTQYSRELSEENEDELSKEILENSKVGSITLTSYLMRTMDDTLSAMNFVVYVLIISAGLLAFIVLYNLANINISERIRELATIKVLGFYDKEVYDYVTREIILLAIIGILAGLLFGYFLNSFILGTCEIGILRFKRIITIPSYIYASLITIVFTCIVNFITYFSLKKVNMIEALKSVE